MTTPTHDTTSPTRDEVFRCLCELGLDNVEYEDAEAILALFKPAIAAAEKRGMERAADIYATASDWDYFSAAEAAIRAEMEKM